MLQISKNCGLFSGGHSFHDREQHVSENGILKLPSLHKKEICLFLVYEVDTSIGVAFFITFYFKLSLE